MGKYLDLIADSTDECEISEITLHGLTLADLREAAADDWPEMASDRAVLEAFAHALATRRLRERGEVPPEYTASTVCSGCGPVPIFPGVPKGVLACPWCFNRLKGFPVPRTPA